MARKRSRTKQRQTQFEFKSRGGPRRGAGRKPKGERALVSHSARPPHSRHHPVHVTARLKQGLPSLRRPGPFRAVLGAFAAGRDRFGFRLVQFSVQSNHLHLIVEAEDETALCRGLQGLMIRLARALNRCWERRGKLFDDRNYRRPLKTPAEVRNALVYVLQNMHRHGIHQQGLDPYSSALWFDGWKEHVRTTPSRIEPVTPARTWLLRIGWRRYGLISVDELPALG